jgi:hypothetical protein
MAVASPIPEEPPVTRATLLDIFDLLLSLCGGWLGGIAGLSAIDS